jgi:hypothetical protein
MYPRNLLRINVWTMLETHVVHIGSKSKRSESVHATQFLLSSIAVHHPKYKCCHENWEAITGGSFMSYVRHIYTPVITVAACQLLCSSEQVIIWSISKLCRPLLKLFSCTLKFVFDKLCYKNCGSYHTHMFDILFLTDYVISCFTSINKRNNIWRSCSEHVNVAKKKKLK